ncbi:unnamed protein product [Ascophyllum nodosum]
MIIEQQDMQRRTTSEPYRSGPGTGTGPFRHSGFVTARRTFICLVATHYQSLPNRLKSIIWFLRTSAGTPR